MFCNKEYVVSKITNKIVMNNLITNYVEMLINSLWTHSLVVRWKAKIIDGDLIEFQEFACVEQDSLRT